MSVFNDILRRGLVEAETRLGVTVVDRGRAELLEKSFVEFEQFREEASELAYHSLSYFTGRPAELTPEARNRLAQRSRIALMQDPLAGAEADLLANFSFGRGITMPQANEEKLQDILEEAWTDPVNEEKLTGFEAQRHRSNELLTQANLYPTAYVNNGYVRLGFLDADTVRFIVCDPEDEERPLFYATHKRRVEWDFETDQLKTLDETNDEGRLKIVYYPHWRNVEDMVAQAQSEDGDAAKPPLPKAEKLGKGFVYHCRINRVGRTQFGTPPWARTLRFFRALNDVTESHVTMAQAASTFIAKRVMKGTPDSIQRSANSILAQTGELGAARFGESPTDSAFPRQQAAPSGSFWLENESNRLEALQLNSGSAQVAQTAQVIRAPIAAASSFGQHYLGDASNANLATATSLELPTLMAVQAWQETFEQTFRWFTDMVIQEAVRAGRLGGMGANRVTATEVAAYLQDAESVEEAEELAWEHLPRHERWVRNRPISDLWIREATDRKEMERRTGLDLGYVLAMPYPGRRNLPDVLAVATQMVVAYDPQGVNVPLRRKMLEFMAVHGMQLDDPTGFVDEVMPNVDPSEAGPDAGTVGGDTAAQLGPAHLMPGIDPATGQPYMDTRSADYVPPEDPNAAPGSASGGTSAGGDKTSKGDKPRGAKTGRTPPKDEMAQAYSLLAEMTGEAWMSEVLDPLVAGQHNGGHG